MPVDTPPIGGGRALVAAIVLVEPDGAALDVVVDGETLLRRCITILSALPRVTRVIVATPVVLLAATEAACTGQPVEVMALGLGTDPLRDLVRSLDPQPDVVVVHDGARGTVRPALVDSVIDEVLRGSAAAAPLTGVTDTVKQVIDGRVLATIDRSTLVSLQTPQAFATSALREQRLADLPLLALEVDGEVRYVPGGPEAQRIPVPEAAVLAEALLRWQHVTQISDDD